MDGWMDKRNKTLLVARFTKLIYDSPLTARLVELRSAYDILLY